MDWVNILSNGVESFFGVEAVIYALAAIGLNVHFGYTGLLNFGQAAFLGVAAYGLATTIATFGLPFFLGVAIGLVGAVILALLLGVPTLRLRADYLAIVTIAAAEIVRLIFRSVTLRNVFGGSDGLQGFSDGFYALNPYPDGEYGIGPIAYNERTMWVLTVGWTLVILSCLLVFLLMRSPWGRVLKAIREDEDAVRSLGKNVFSYKMQALVLGGVLGCLGGFLFALARAAVQPDTFGTELTFFVYVVLILGGAARVLGPVLGAMIFWALLSLTDGILNSAVRAGNIPSQILIGNQVGQVRFMLVGLGLMLLMIYRPQGIFGDRRELALDVR
ncbi:MAG: branched-chain amino acid ABC transporter permease [Acidothermales bacterium]|jgi:branched-chain amino acid transport system permease protein|nr:branched-chain amino acid ABC transporter permease [Acidothermales bacterium]